MKVNGASSQYNTISGTYVTASGGFADVLSKEIKEQERIKSEKVTKRIVERKDNSSSIDLNIL